MHTIEIPHNSFHCVRLPKVYRYLNAKFIDEFFNTGKLKIGTFKRFREYPDEILGDKNEGRGLLRATSDKENFSFNIHTPVGDNAYILCCSLINTDELRKKFNADSCFVINDPLKFSIAISKALNGFDHSRQGFCNYQEYRMIKKTLSGLSIDDMTDKEGRIIEDGRIEAKVFKSFDPIEIMFLKESRYSYQQEYRLTWTIDTRYHDLSKEFILCKEAIEYCDRL